MWNVLSMSLLHLALWAESARVLPPANPCPISLCAYCSRSGRMVQHTQISYRRAPAATRLPFVIPAAAGIHAPSFRARTSLAIPPLAPQRNTRNRHPNRSSRPKHSPYPDTAPESRGGVDGTEWRSNASANHFSTPASHSSFPRRRESTHHPSAQERQSRYHHLPPSVTPEIGPTIGHPGQNISPYPDTAPESRGGEGGPCSAGACPQPRTSRPSNRSTAPPISSFPCSHVPYPDTGPESTGRR